MKIFDAIVFLASIALMTMALGWGVDLPMSVKYIFLAMAAMAVIDYCDR